MEPTVRWQHSERQQKGQQIGFVGEQERRTIVLRSVSSRIYILYENEHDVVILNQYYNPDTHSSNRRKLNITEYRNLPNV